MLRLFCIREFVVFSIVLNLKNSSASEILWFLVGGIYIQAHVPIYGSKNEVEMLIPPSLLRVF